MEMAYALLLLLGISIGIMIGVLCLDHRDSRAIGSLTSQRDSLLAEVKRLELHRKFAAGLYVTNKPGMFRTSRECEHFMIEQADKQIKTGRLR